jgi:coenzyme F420-reducing hydrogenase beta subunit
MIDKLEHEKCCGCEACRSVCKANAIAMVQDDEGFFYPNIDKNKCISCNKCEKACPVLNKKSENQKFVKAFACFNRDEAIREQSTSGGIFSALAEYIINEKNGIVYGVEFDEAFNVKYGKTSDVEGLKAFRGSKYVQSQVNDVYEDIRIHLEAGEYVLFSGLPCQIEALNRVLDKEYDNLYLVDMICFGVGSPLIWDNYLNEFHDRENISEIVFKEKKYGWKEWRVNIVESEEKQYFDKKKNLYVNSYLQRINIRPSCYRCEFKGLYRKSDFTIADCWGVGEDNKDLNDDKGLSALLIHSKKAMSVFESIKDKLKYEEYVAEELMSGNKATYYPVEENPNRSDFFDKWKKSGFKLAFIQYFGD